MSKVYFGRTQSIALMGVQGYPIQIEADLQYQLPSFHIVGLPGTMVRESKDRVRSAIKNSGFEFPSRKITVNLVPGNLRKDRVVIDLPIALAILEAGQEIPDGKGAEFFSLGELSLDGAVLPTQGILPAILEANRNGAKQIFVPRMTGAEKRVIESVSLKVRVIEVTHLKEAVEIIKGVRQVSFEPPSLNLMEPLFNVQTNEELLDFSSIFGQELAKKALMVAAVGSHHCLISGAKGLGKSTLAKCYPSILPPLKQEEKLEVLSIYSSLSGEGFQARFKNRPFRAPHSQSSAKAFFGGGSSFVPGEITLSHRGVLLMDEFPEFTREIREGLRQPLQEKNLTFVRLGFRAQIPCAFQLIATRNLCPCGNRGTPDSSCSCTEGGIEKYRARLSEAVLDRIEIQIFVQNLSNATSLVKRGLSTEEMRLQVKEALDFKEREPSEFNLEYFLKTFEPVFIGRKVSFRFIQSTMRVAQSVAALEFKREITRSHVEEALFLKGVTL